MIGCTFCEIASGTAKAWRVYEDEKVVAFFNKGSVAEFHTLVIPKRHSTDIFDTDINDFQAVSEVIHRICRHYKSNLGISSVQIICSNGAEAKQDMFHMHFHIVPRRKDDGQDVCWTPDRTVNQRFDELLERARLPYAGE
ncbi:HIT family protein [Pseudahrensia aquimaris]|uniref:HIT family protein n=1 Tax=Pseudahrensia aquimaris TaxID=744461 RepID=A0ABW3FD83_9HYPH